MSSVWNWVHHPTVLCRCRRRLCHRFWCHVQQLLHWLRTIRNRVSLHSFVPLCLVDVNRLASNSSNCLALDLMMHGSSYSLQLWSASLSWSPFSLSWWQSVASMCTTIINDRIYRTNQRKPKLKFPFSFSFV